LRKKGNNSGVDYWKIARLVIALGLMCFLLFSVSQRLSGNIEDVVIEIDKNADRKNLITSKEVKAILKYELGYEASLAEVGQIDLYGVEKALMLNDRIDNARVYLDKYNILHVNVRQKRPIVRIDVSGGKDYYLDYRGDRVPVTDVFRVPVVTGHIDAYSSNYQSNVRNNLNAVVKIARKVHDDEFLTALVEQIYVDENDELTLVPKVGRDKILLGQAEDLDEKIYKLKTYYERGIKNIGLDRFDELDLKYKGQIVGRQKDT